MNKTISIVVPVYNAEKYIEETMDSVLNQTYGDWELILVLNGCVDSSEQIIRRYQQKYTDKNIRVIVEEKNVGAANARNGGVNEASGRYIAYVDADDIWNSEKLERSLSFMEEKNAAFLCTGYEFADEFAKGTGKVVYVPSTLNYREALKNTTIFTSTVMFDTQKIPKEKIQMPNIKSEDTALWWKLLREGYLVYGLNENLVLYRRPKKSLSSNKLEAIRRVWNLYRKAEGLSVVYSAYNFCFWAIRAVLRRV
jgi:teichuronic acid biosynthesis glycosyltransferase TuaG